MTRLVIILVLLALAPSSSASAQAVPLERTPSSSSGGCNGASAVCLAQSYTATSKFVVQGTTGPQFDSTGAAPLEFRSNAPANANGAFRFWATNSITSNYLVDFSEKAGTTAEPRFTVDHQGTGRFYPESVGLQGGGLEMFGPLSQTNGGSDGPFIINGGVNTTAFTGRLLSIRRPVGAVQVLNVRADGSIQFAGVITGSLGSCNGSAANTIQWDNTVGGLVACNGTAPWKQIAYVP
jgi:hypothetical protein